MQTVTKRQIYEKPDTRRNARKASTLITIINNFLFIILYMLRIWQRHVHEITFIIIEGHYHHYMTRPLAPLGPFYLCFFLAAKGTHMVLFCSYVILLIGNLINMKECKHYVSSSYGNNYFSSFNLPNQILKKKNSICKNVRRKHLYIYMLK